MSDDSAPVWQVTCLRLLAWLPLPVLYWIARLGYVVLYFVAGYRKAVVRENLAAAFPDKSGTQLTELAKKFYLRLAEVSVEIIKTGRMSEQDFRHRVQLNNPELVRQCSNDFQDSVIVLTIHQGNWEWMLHGCTATLGVAMDPVYKPLHSKSVDALVYELRSRFGSRPVPIKDATRDILRRRRQFRLLVMVADQSPIRRERSYWTRFLNREAAFYLGAESIACMTGFPVVFAQCRRRARGHYEIDFKPLALPPHSDAGHQITESYVRMAEQAIREEPESWLWSNRRWKRNRGDGVSAKL